MTLASVYAFNMYPSTKLAKIRKLVRFFSRGLTAATKNKINLYLDLIHFGMSSTLISFDREYYRYHVGYKKEQELAIGGYESAFLVDLVAYYLFGKSKHLLNQNIYHCIYRDAVLVVFKGKKSAQEIKYWLSEFQQIVDNGAGN